MSQSDELRRLRGGFVVRSWRKFFAASSAASSAPRRPPRFVAPRERPARGAINATRCSLPLFVGGLKRGRLVVP